MNFIAKLRSPFRQYLVVTANYWLFTLTDGALRMLIVLHFFSQGYRPLQIAMLFVFYEAFGVVTNLLGGWLGAKVGLNKTMNIGLFLQIIALSMLLAPEQQLSMLWLMAAQALSGIAKDLNKMSAKSAIKTLLPAAGSSSADTRMYTWVAALTGSKNTLKGVGFFVGGALLAALGFTGAISVLLLPLILIWLFSLLVLQKDLGRAKTNIKFTQLLAKNRKINYLSAARLFLFASRDVWFVIALPLYLASAFNWEHWQVGSFFAIWIIFYGLIQSMAPKLTRRSVVPDGGSATRLGLLLLVLCLMLSSAFSLDYFVSISLVAGLFVFAAVFALNSAQHSYLIIKYADSNAVSLDVGFYYMANAAGRLAGTVLSGLLYQSYGLAACLWVSVLFVAIASFLASKLPRHTR
ncbi:MAG: organoarsenical effux MFS transporter ArsJ [Pseudomonadales bacterium]|nr:organoarsenical effux MFS transporter ArsJ [Pseudomonadales bacterium]NRA16503.1 organoarsenical effux MFS transporter ArsJ [Oceanospirillaceae bacterium]